MEKNDFITGEKFITLADMVYYPKGADDANPLENTFCFGGLKELSIVYTHTLYVKKLFELIDRIKARFIVITHNCDEIVDDSYVVPGNVIKWFAQNVAISNPKIESIPIGLENERWFRKLNKKDKMISKLSEDRRLKNLVYVNCNINTNPLQRNPVYWFFEGKENATIESGTNGKNFDEYLDNIYNHKFVACPEGNGIDTHRTWETLYMGSIPIEKRNINNGFYRDLPICFVDEWAICTPEFLNSEYLRIKKENWNLEKLTFSYWEKKIRDVH